MIKGYSILLEDICFNWLEKEGEERKIYIGDYDLNELGQIDLDNIPNKQEFKLECKKYLEQYMPTITNNFEEDAEFELMYFDSLEKDFNSSKYKFHGVLEAMVGDEEIGFEVYDIESSDKEYNCSIGASMRVHSTENGEHVSKKYFKSSIKSMLGKVKSKMMVRNRD